MAVALLTVCVTVSDPPIVTDLLASFCVQLEPPSREYSIKKYAVACDEPLFEIANVDVFEAPVQLADSVWDPDVEILHDTSELALPVAVGVPVNVALDVEVSYLQVIFEPTGTLCVNVSVLSTPTDWLASLVCHEPLSILYSTFTYAVVVAEAEFVIAKLDVAALLEQLPSDEETLTSITGQSTVALFISLAVT
jgi:hypothetical protein